MVLKIEVYLKKVTGERLNGVTEPLGSTVVDTNLSLAKVEKQNGIPAIKVSFEFVAKYTPAVAHIQLNGVAVITGDEQELTAIYNECVNKRPLPVAVMQVISNFAFVTATLTAQNLNVPWPIPLPQIPNSAAQLPL
jgi:hypothetical protein